MCWAPEPLRALCTGPGVTAWSSTCTHTCAHTTHVHAHHTRAHAPPPSRYLSGTRAGTRGRGRWRCCWAACRASRRTCRRCGYRPALRRDGTWRCPRPHPCREPGARSHASPSPPSPRPAGTLRPLSPVGAGRRLMLRWHSSLYAFQLSKTKSVIWAEGPWGHRGASPTPCPQRPPSHAGQQPRLGDGHGRLQANAPCSVMPCCAVLCRAMLCCTVPCRAAPCHAAPRGWEGGQERSAAAAQHAAAQHATARGCCGQGWISGILGAGSGLGAGQSTVVRDGPSLPGSRAAAAGG